VISKKLRIGFAILASLIITGCSTGYSSSPAPTVSPNTILVSTRVINGENVLTNTKGFTLYAFGPDTSTQSKCNGSCAVYWPPLTTVSAVSGDGVYTSLTTVTRANGTKQVAYDGHPLYTYAGDTKPGEDNGNGVNASGGYWEVVPVSGKVIFPSTSKSSGY
jgi:predicted lipoprotein with Yx(FWY)xxD motif